MSRLFFTNHSAIQNIVFTKNSSDFVVSEIPLYEFSNNGEHLVLHIRKKDMTTWEMLHSLSEFCGAKMRDFGYAGLKDRDGMTTQYISLHRNYAQKLENFSHPNIKILSQTYHNNKIKMGHLKGNRFFIRLKKVLPTDALKLSQACKKIAAEGYPNYFGYQRFGKLGDNFEQGRAILKNERKERNRKLSDLLISAYQSELFNRWLSRRIEICKYFESFDENEIKAALSWDKELIKSIKKQPQFFKLLSGDVCHHYPHGKAFICENVEAELERFLSRQTTVTGFLVGKRAMRAEDLALTIEQQIYAEADEFIDKMDGSRRYAWSFTEDFEYRYKEEEAWFEMNFSLHKGSYATVVLEEILHRELGAQ